jgi:hypothetical protein
LYDGLLAIAKVLGEPPIRNSMSTSWLSSAGPLPESIHTRPLVVAYGFVLVFWMLSTLIPPLASAPAHGKARTANKPAIVIADLMILVLRKKADLSVLR